MNLLSDVITYIRRIIKSPSNNVITDNLIIDYINRFWIMDVDARMQLFDLKTKYQFQTTPGISDYNMPLYDLQLEGVNPTQSINFYPVYQGFLPPARVNGINVPFYSQRSEFFNLWPDYVQNNIQIGTGNGTTGPYTFNIPYTNLIPGHVDITGIIATGVNQDPILGTSLNTLVPITSVYSRIYFTATGANGQNIIVQDSGQFLSDNTDSDLYGLLMSPQNAPAGGASLPGGYQNTFTITGITQATQAVVTATTTLVAGQTVQVSGVVGMTEINDNTYQVVSVTGTTVTLDVDSTSFTAYVSGGIIFSLQNVINYTTGVASEVFFQTPIPSGTPINAQCYYIQPGLPRALLFYNNIISLRNPPNTQYLVELDAYLTPAAYLTTSSAIQFGYMAEYIARGAARKILSDTGDTEQFQFYEPLFREQETLVWKRSQRQFTSTRTQTIYSNSGFQANYNQSSGGI